VTALRIHSRGVRYRQAGTGRVNPRLTGAGHWHPLPPAGASWRLVDLLLFDPDIDTVLGLSVRVFGRAALSAELPSRRERGLVAWGLAQQRRGCQDAVHELMCRSWVLSGIGTCPLPRLGKHRNAGGDQAGIERDVGGR
jgi:hypothetical protein